MKKILSSICLILTLSGMSQAAVIGAVKDAGWVGAYTAGATVNIDFTTYDTTGGLATTLAGTPKADVYCNGSATPAATALTITADLNMVTGLNTVAIDTTGYSAGKCTAIISAGTVTTSVVGFRIGNFTVGTPQSSDLRSVNGGSTGSTAGQLNLDKLIVSPASSGTAVSITGNGTGYALDLGGGATANKALYVHADGNGDAALISGAGTGSGVTIQTGNTSNSNSYALKISNRNDGIGIYTVTTTNGNAIELDPAGTGSSIYATGPITVSPGNSPSDAVALYAQGSGKALNLQGQLNIAPSNTNDDAIKLVPNGTGLPINNSGITLRTNVAFSNFPFLMFNTSGALTSGLTVTCTVSIDGAAFAACTNSPSGISAGAYKVNLAAADLNGKAVVLKFTATGAKPTLIPIILQN